MFKTIKTIRVSQSVAHQIRDLIIGGKLAPGQRLPSEKDLSEKLGVSKSMLREAIRILETLGMITVRQGVQGGAFVCEIDGKTVQEHLYNYLFFQDPHIKDFTQLRLMIEPSVAKIAAQKITDKDVAELDDLLVRTKNELDKDEFFYELDNTFHHKLSELTGNPVIVFVVDSMKAAVAHIKKARKTIPRSFFFEVYEAHLEIVGALKARDPEGAQQAMRKHIKEVEVTLDYSNGDMAPAFAADLVSTAQSDI